MDPSSSDDEVEEVLARLRSSGGRVTTPRRLLVRCLFEASGHRTAEELTAEIQARAPDVSISTVYRNLEELERLGVVVHAHLGHGPAIYHLASAAHGHLVCERCECHIEFADGFFADLRGRAIADFGFAIDPPTLHGDRSVRGVPARRRRARRHRRRITGPCGWFGSRLRLGHVRRRSGLPRCVSRGARSAYAEPVCHCLQNRHRNFRSDVRTDPRTPRRESTKDPCRCGCATVATRVPPSRIAISRRSLRIRSWPCGGVSR